MFKWRCIRCCVSFDMSHELYIYLIISHELHQCLTFSYDLHVQIAKNTKTHSLTCVFWLWVMDFAYNESRTNNESRTKLCRSQRQTKGCIRCCTDRKKKILFGIGIQWPIPSNSALNQVDTCMYICIYIHTYTHMYQPGLARCCWELAFESQSQNVFFSFCPCNSECIFLSVFAICKMEFVTLCQIYAKSITHCQKTHVSECVFVFFAIWTWNS